MAITADDILDLISQEVPIDRALLDPSATLESLDIASLDMISVMFALEERYKLSLEQEDVAHATTLQELIDILLAKARAAGV